MNSELGFFSSMFAVVVSLSAECLMHFGIQLAWQISVFTCMFDKHYLFWETKISAICKCGCCSIRFLLSLLYSSNGRIAWEVLQQSTSANINRNTNRVDQWVDARCFFGLLFILALLSGPFECVHLSCFCVLNIHFICPSLQLVFCPMFCLSAQFSDLNMRVSHVFVAAAIYTVYVYSLQTQFCFVFYPHFIYLWMKIETKRSQTNATISINMEMTMRMQ